jgi:hypothetical protein
VFVYDTDTHGKYFIWTCPAGCDRLIQLCDSISMFHGAVLMEKRLIDVVMRHGLPEWTLRKWNEYFSLKQHFDSLAKCNIYALLPDIVENTFEWR